MSIDSEIELAVATRDDVSALACMDGDAGIVLGLFARGEVERDAVENAIHSLPATEESIVAEGGWVHAFVRVPGRPSLIVVGLARGGARVDPLRAWLREVAGRVGAAA